MLTRYTDDQSKHLQLTNCSVHKQKVWKLENQKIKSDQTSLSEIWNMQIQTKHDTHFIWVSATAESIVKNNLKSQTARLSRNTPARNVTVPVPVYPGYQRQLAC